MTPVPWGFIVRLVLSTGFTVLWAVAYPHAPVWQLFLVCLVAIAVLEGLRYGYRSEQQRIKRQRAARELPPYGSWRSQPDPGRKNAPARNSGPRP